LLVAQHTGSPARCRRRSDPPTTPGGLSGGFCGRRPARTAPACRRGAESA